MSGVSRVGKMPSGTLKDCLDNLSLEQMRGRLFGIEELKTSLQVSLQTLFSDNELKLFMFKGTSIVRELLRRIAEETRRSRTSESDQDVWRPPFRLPPDWKDNPNLFLSTLKMETRNVQMICKAGHQEPVHINTTPIIATMQPYKDHVLMVRSRACHLCHEPYMFGHSGGFDFVPLVMDIGCVAIQQLHDAGRHMLLALAAVAVRLWVRCRMIRNFGWDDENRAQKLRIPQWSCKDSSSTTSPSSM